MCIGGGSSNQQQQQQPRYTWNWWQPMRMFDTQPLVKLNDKATDKDESLRNRVGTKRLQIPLGGAATLSGLGIPTKRSSIDK